MDFEETKDRYQRSIWAATLIGVALLLVTELNVVSLSVSMWGYIAFTVASAAFADVLLSAFEKRLVRVAGTGPIVGAFLGGFVLAPFAYRYGIALLSGMVATVGVTLIGVEVSEYPSGHPVFHIIRSVSIVSPSVLGLHAVANKRLVADSGVLGVTGYNLESLFFIIALLALALVGYELYDFFCQGYTEWTPDVVWRSVLVNTPLLAFLPVENSIQVLLGAGLVLAFTLYVLYATARSSGVAFCMLVMTVFVVEIVFQLYLSGVPSQIVFPLMLAASMVSLLISVFIGHKLENRVSFVGTGPVDVELLK